MIRPGLAFALLAGATQWGMAPAGAQPLSLCEPAGELATLIETVRDRQTRVPLTGATVSASWPGSTPLRLRVDSMGRTRICAPPNLVITLNVSYREIRSAPQTTVLAPGRITEHTFSVDAPGVFVRGAVTERTSGAAIANVAVRIANTPLTALTDAAGRFQFERVPIGDFQLRIEHLAYAAISTPLLVRDEDLDAAVRMTPAAIPLEPVIVTAFSQRLDRVGFYERERRGIGTFIGRKQVDAMNVQHASDLLRSVPSARLIPQTTRRNAPPNSLSGRGACRFKFIVDGTRTLADFEMDFVAAHVIEGVEVYSGLSEVPALFKAHATPDAGSALCGVVAIWTRERR
jgi:hypothetical protein